MTNYQDLKSRIIRHAAIERIPVLGEFELTSKCNFACPMCYVRDNDPKNELTKEEWIAIFDEAVSEGLVYALLTGGETLVRPDFIDLYTHLYDLGVRITVYTNGYHISDQHLETFKKRPPELVAITLYGASDETYLKVTKIREGYTNVTDNILRLKRDNINVACRVIPIPEVYADLDGILDFVRENDIPLGYFLYLAPSRNNDYKGRMLPEKLVDFEEKILSAYSREKTAPTKDFDGLSSCAALKSGYGVNHDGYMQPCTLISYPSRKLLPGELLKTFRELGDKWRCLAKSHDCEICKLREYCISCPARRYLEGDIHKCAPYLLAVAKERKRRHG